MNKLIIITLISSLLYSCNVEKEYREKEKREVPSSNEFKPSSYVHKMLMGQSVYVPIYSSLYSEYEEKLFHMTGILSIRNISPKNSITISKIDYYDTNGKLIKSFINQQFTLGAMSSKDFVIAQSDLTGGTGANFIVTWGSQKPISIPIIEAVMIGSIGTKGFSFSSRGKEIEAH